MRVIRDELGVRQAPSGRRARRPVHQPGLDAALQRAAAVVVDSGGPMSHAAIVAREYGIPAVMATGDGTARLADGDGCASTVPAG